MGNEFGMSCTTVSPDFIIRSGEEVLNHIREIRRQKLEAVYNKFVGKKYGYWWNRKVLTREDVIERFESGRVFNDVRDAWEYDDAKNMGVKWERDVERLVDLAVVARHNQTDMVITANDYNLLLIDDLGGIMLVVGGY